MIASPVRAAIAILTANPDLAALHGGRVSTDLQPGGPAIRATLLPGPATQTAWEWQGNVQVECWAADELDADALASAVRASWPGFRGPAGGAYVSGTWIVVEPASMPDGETGRPRYILTCGLACHEVP